MISVVWILFIFLEVYRNYILIERYKTQPDYIKSFIIRAMASIIHGALFVNVRSMDEFIPILFLQATSFWILFDLLLNVIRGKPIIYKGTGSGWLDGLPLIVWVVLKLTTFIIGLIVVLKLYY